MQRFQNTTYGPVPTFTVGCADGKVTAAQLPTITRASANHPTRSICQCAERADKHSAHRSIPCLACRLQLFWCHQQRPDNSVTYLSIKQLSALLPKKTCVGQEGKRLATRQTLLSEISYPGIIAENESDCPQKPYVWITSPNP